MASFDVKSVSANIAKETNSSLEASHKLSSHATQSASNNAVASVADQAVVVESLYVMTPDGVIHRREGDEYVPEITIHSYTRLKPMMKLDTE